MKCCKLKISIGIYLVFIAIRNKTNELSKGVYIVRTSIDGKVIIKTDQRINLFGLVVEEKC
jgi:hypothetical protein